MMTFEQNEAFEARLEELYETVLLPFQKTINQNQSLYAQVDYSTGPGFQESADKAAEVPKKSSIDLSVFRHDNQLLEYVLTYSDEYQTTEGRLIEACFYRSAKTRFFATKQETMQEAAAVLNALFSEKGVSDEVLQETADGQRDFPLDLKLLKQAVQADLQYLMHKVIMA